MSYSGPSSASSHDPDRPPSPPVDSFYVRALYDYSGVDTSSLSFRAGEVIEVLSTLESGWWDGILCEAKVRGWFPSNYVEQITEEEAIRSSQEMIDWWNATHGAGEVTATQAQLAAALGQVNLNPDFSTGAVPVNGAAGYGLDGSVDPMAALDAFMGEHGADGGNIFGEIAAAAAAADHPTDHRQSQQYQPSFHSGSISSHDHVDERDSGEFWVPKITPDGQVVYFNQRTGQTSLDIPTDPTRHAQQPDPATFLANDSEEDTFHDTLSRPISMPPALVLPPGSQPTPRGLPVRAQTGDGAFLSAFTERPASSQRSGSGAGHGSDPLARLSYYSDDSALDAELSSASARTRPASKLDTSTIDTKDRRRSKSGGRRKGPSTAQLLEPAPLPLVSELEAIAAGALQALVNGAGVADRSAGAESGEEERVRLVSLNEGVVGAVRAILHATGMTEAGLSRSDTPSPSGVLPVSLHPFLYPYSRRLNSALAKLGLTVRALGEQLQATHSSPRESRFEAETRARADVLANARTVQDNVAGFLDEFARRWGGLSAVNGGPPLPRNLLRACRALEGALKTNAAALLLPGGGYGGNWRGNGFVTLPAAEEGEGAKEGGLAYAYPSKPISAEVVAALEAEPAGLLAEAETLKTTVEELKPVPGSAPPAKPPASLLEQASQLQRRMGGFLNAVEEIDVAAGVDFELSPDQVSRGNSPRPPSGSELAPAGADAGETGGDKASAEYKASVLEAKPLLTELEVRKQALYDVAPALLIALQELYLPTPPSAATDSTQAVLDVLASLRTALPALCETMTALAKIAQMQASAPSNVRNPSLAFRNSIFSLPTSPSISSVSESRAHSNLDELANSPALSRHSLELADRRNRDSQDSGDFFFSSGTATTATTAGSSTAGLKTKPSLKQLFGAPTTPGWDHKRGSLANSVLSNASDGSGSLRQSLGGLSSPSRSKLAKVLGPESPGSGASSPVRSMSYVEQLPPWLGPDYGPDEISFDMENRVRGGTLCALVIAAASHEGRVDSNYLSAFLMTYRTFCTPHELLDVLRERYLIAPPEEAGDSEANLKLWETRKQKPIRARVANVLKSWVREHMEHDEVDPEVLHRIAEFAQRTMRDPVQSPQIIKAVEERLKTNPAAARPVSNVAPGAIPSSIVPRSLRKLKFMDIDPLELARQLTLRDSRLFGKITPQECLGKAWPKQFGSDAPNISSMIDMSNAVTRWVTETILAFEDAKKRASAIKQFVLVAERCLGLNNFSTLIHIVAGLNSTPIHRLKRTWEQVSQKTMLSLGMLNNIMKPDKNYKEYREALRGVAPPCVPFLGVYLTDWTFIGDGNPDMLREKPHQINFNKRQKASELILMIKMHQTTSYNLAQVPVITRFIEEQLKPGSGNPSQDDQRLYEISLQREPRENEDVKIARLLSESGFL